MHAHHLIALDIEYVRIFSGWVIVVMEHPRLEALSVGMRRSSSFQFFTTVPACLERGPTRCPARGLVRPASASEYAKPMPGAGETYVYTGHVRTARSTHSQRFLPVGLVACRNQA